MATDLSKYTTVGLQFIIDNKEKFIESNTPVMRLNRDNILVIVPMTQIEKLYDKMYSDINIDESNYTFYITNDYKNVFGAIFNLSKFGTEEEKVRVKTSTDRMKHFSSLDTYGKRVHISRLKERIRDILKTDTLDQDGVNVLTDAFTDVNMITRVTLVDTIKDINNISSMDIKIREGSNEITKDITNFMKDIIALMEKNSETRTIFDSMKDDSDNDTFKHSNRVCMLYTNFLIHYNNAINNGIVNKTIRRCFSSHYIKYYEEIFKKFNIRKGIDQLEDVVDRGMSAILKSDIVLYSMASLIHDIGKFDESNNFNDGSILSNAGAENHLFNSFNIVKKAAEYPPEVVAIVGYHHEYYGNGYGPFAAQYKEKVKTTPDFSARFALTYDIAAINNCNAVAYFPAKMLEIVDVYDSLLYPLGRKIITGSSKKIVELIRKKFIDNQVCLDPILFDIFVDYLQKMEEKEDLSSLKIY